MQRSVVAQRYGQDLTAIKKQSNTKNSDKENQGPRTLTVLTTQEIVRSRCLLYVFVFELYSQIVFGNVVNMEWLGFHKLVYCVALC